jgi:hypothetical protein
MELAVIVISLQSTAGVASRSETQVLERTSATVTSARFERTSDSIVRAVARQLFTEDLIAREDPAAAETPQGHRG